jgi:hypothetical protein
MSIVPDAHGAQSARDDAAKSSSYRSAISRMAFSSWSECGANTMRCRPQGAYRPKIQFFDGALVRHRSNRKRWTFFRQE